MSSQFSTRSRRLALLAAALALLVALVATPMASADTSGEVTVTASVTNESLSLTLCDTEANFGTGLNSHGATPQNTNDAVSATTEGTNPGEGVYYKWIP